jgi:hypothetical protein
MQRTFIRLIIGVAAWLPAWATLNAGPSQLQGGFTQINMQDGGYLTGLIQHNSGRLICRTDGGGIYRSDNGGFMWTFLSGNMTSAGSLAVQGIAMPQTTNSSSNLILQATGDKNNNADMNKGVWKSTDGGATWTQTLSSVMFYGGGNERIGGECIIFHPTNDLEAWAGSHTNGLWKSMDGGSTWTSNSAFSATNIVASVYIHPSYPDQIFVAGDGGLAVSTNHGTSWTQVMSTGGIIYRVTRGADGTVYFCGLNGSTHILQKITSTNNWTNAAGYVFTDLSGAYTSSGWLSTGNPINLLTILRDGRLVAGDYDNTRVSTDGGVTFTSCSTSYVPGSVVPQWALPTLVNSPDCLVQDVFASNTWYGGSGNAPVRTDDGGQHWQFILNGIGEVAAWKVAFSPVDPNRIYIPQGDQGGAIVTDGGISGNTVSEVKGWYYLNTSIHTMWSHRVLVSQSNGVNRAIFTGQNEGNDNPNLYITINDGTSWYSPPLTGLPITNEQGIIDAIDSLDAPDDFLVVIGGNSGTNMGGVYRTTNAGTNFSQCNWYPATSVGLGSGSYWEASIDRDATNLNVRYLYSFAKGAPATPPAANNGSGMFISYDRGATWTQEPWPLVSGDTTDYSFYLVADRAISGSVWLWQQSYHNYNHCLIHSTNYGTNWTIVGTFTNALAADAYSNNVVVFGQMTNGANTNDQWCKIYYSTNTGTNWNEVTGPGYRFGNAHELTLDPYRPGRIFISTGERSVGIFTPGTPEQQWQLDYFMSTNSAQSAGGANPDGNGLPNLVQYALGGDPLYGLASDPLASSREASNATSFLPYATISTNPLLSGQPVMRLNLPDPPPSDINVLVLSSSDLVNWTTNAMRSGTNAWQWLGTGSSLIAPGLDTNGRALFDIGTPNWSNAPGQYQCIQVETN